MKPKEPWIDPDDAPPWTPQTFARAEVKVGDIVVKPATGTLTQPSVKCEQEKPK